MESMDICPVCKTESVISDEENGQKVRVCTECGAMDVDMQDFTNAGQYEGTTLTDGQSRGPDGLKHRSYLNRVCKGLTLGRKLIRTLAPTLHFNRDMTEDATKLYERVFEEDVKSYKRDRRRAMCMACLYVVAKLNDHGLHIRNIGKHLDIAKPYKKFGYALNILKDKYHVKLPKSNICSDAYQMLSEKSFSLQEINLVQKLFPLLYRSWISEGRQSTPTIIVTAYFVWKASNLSRRKVSYTKFSKMFGFILYKKRKTEIEDLLKAMARELPWVQMKGNEEVDITLHLADIIRYQNLLFDSALRTAIQNMKLEQEENNSDTDEDAIADIDVKGKHETVFKREYIPSCAKRDKDEENELLVTLESQPKRMKRESEDGRDEDLDGDDDFDLGSDDDTSQYIRTVKEVQEIEALLAKAENV